MILVLNDFYLRESLCPRIQTKLLWSVMPQTQGKRCLPKQGVIWVRSKDDKRCMMEKEINKRRRRKEIQIHSSSQPGTRSECRQDVLSGTVFPSCWPPTLFLLQTHNFLPAPHMGPSACLGSKRREIWAKQGKKLSLSLDSLRVWGSSRCEKWHLKDLSLCWNGTLGKKSMKHYLCLY